MPILTPEERIGTLVADRYRFERVLARGGMSVLFAGSDVRAHRPVVLKLLRPHDAVDEVKIARFLQETQTAALLRHPYVVDVLDMGKDVDGVPYLVMEHLHGRSLGDELAERGRLPPEEALALLLPVLGALAKVHEAGVVHRDVKPENIFLARDTRGAVTPKLLDFGIAKVLESPVETRTGAMLGTPEYMAPEQAKGEEVGPHTDVWGMGAVLYRCLAGRSPFEASTPAEVIAKIVREAPAPLALQDVPRSFTASVERALVRDPAGRYPDMRTFARALVVSARDAGIAVPEAPDPLGLPDAPRWLAEGTAEPTQTLDALIAAAPVIAAPSIEAPGAARLSPAGLALALAALAVVTALVAYVASDGMRAQRPGAPESQPAAMLDAPAAVAPDRSPPSGVQPPPVAHVATTDAVAATTDAVTATTSAAAPQVAVSPGSAPAPPVAAGAASVPVVAPVPNTVSVATASAAPTRSAAPRPRRPRLPRRETPAPKKDDALPVATEW